MDIILKYFPDLTPEAIDKLSRLEPLYRDWNSKINVISRKDIDHFYLHHVLHSLAISRFVTIPVGSTLLDVGTGGGFPGIPLAIIYPGCRFTLIDSIAKKCKVAEAVAEELDLKNVKVINGRAEEIKVRYDFVIARAVAPFETLISWTSGNIVRKGKGGYLFLKGGDLSSELEGYKDRVDIHDITTVFPEEHFKEKKILFMKS